jgi:cardiolipin synthase
VADRRWARVGSSNLNIASWLGNYELDAVVEDEGFAGIMAEQYERDLGNATEVLLPRERRRHVWQVHRDPRAARTQRRLSGGDSGSAGRAVAGAVRLGNTVTAAVIDHRVLQPADARIVESIGLVLLIIAGLVLRWPRLLAIPAALLLVWIGGALLVRAMRLRRRAQPDAGTLPETPQQTATPPPS